MIYQCVCTLRKFLQTRPGMRELINAVWERYQHDGAQAPGPIGLVRRALLGIGWSWDAPDCFTRPSLPPLPVVGGQRAWWEHELRDGIRLSLWKRVANRRSDMVGLDSPAGIDRVATMAAIDSNKTTPYEAGTLKGIISGSLRLQQRLFVAGLVASPVCPFCNLEDETLEHCFWKCPRWHMLRTQSDIPTLEVCNRWPPCTRECGIFVEHEEVLALKAELENEEHEASRTIEAFCNDHVREQAAAMSQQGRILLWTDGACTNNQDHRLR